MTRNGLCQTKWISRTGMCPSTAGPFHWMKCILPFVTPIDAKEKRQCILLGHEGPYASCSGIPAQNEAPQALGTPACKGGLRCNTNTKLEAFFPMGAGLQGGPC